MITLPTAGRALIALLPLAAALAGCGMYQPATTVDREAKASCKADADRVYAARNRYQMSERDQTDTPNGGSQLGGVPSAGLSDRYEQQQLVDTCLARSAAGEPNAH
jgi:hypothetical protein